MTSLLFSLLDSFFFTLHLDIYFQEILDKHDANLAFFFWTHEMLPLDIFILALIDRDDDPHALIIAVCSHAFYLK